MSRPPIELTELIEQRICEAFRVGASLEQAAKYAGISRRTLKRWIERSKSEKTGELSHLWRHIEKAKAELVIALLIKINHAATKNWKAAVWSLKHACPDLYGKNSDKTDPSEEADPFDEDDQLN